MSSTDKRVTLHDALVHMVGERKVTLDIEVLNPALCAVEASLPKVAPGAIKVDFCSARPARPIRQGAISSARTR